MPPHDQTPRRCPKCGGELVWRVLNYWMAPGDHFFPADTGWVCQSCNRTVSKEVSRGPSR